MFKLNTAVIILPFISLYLFLIKWLNSVKECSIYVTHFPCLNCTKALIQSGIKHIYYKNDYRIDEYALELLDIAKVTYTKL